MAQPQMKPRHGADPAPQPTAAQPGPERHGPAERLVGDIHQVPPVPTIPYTLGMTPRQQTRVLVVSVTIWAFITALIFLSG